MSVRVDNERFIQAHGMFTQYMFDKSNGVPFTSFQHPFLVDDEVSYKWAVYRKAKDALCLNKWKQLKKVPGKIIQAVKEACDPTVSANLLEHRYGLLNSSEGALYRVTKSEEIRGLESQIFDFFSGGSSAPEEFGLRFNVFADYLRENHLGCKWPFLAYLAFLLRVQTYFPVLPSRFDALLQFYGIEKSISGHVSWERYSILLELAEVLKSKLGMYGQPSAIEIQSYMWVVSYLIKGKKVRRKSTKKPDFNSELEARVKRAGQRERIGWAGEWFVYNHEISKLKDVERADLANRVQLVSSDGKDVGFDILSFNPDGSKLHIEVKTTTRSPVDDNGFWLSETEKRRAERDDCWTLYRVWNIDLSPSYENLGNIVSQKNEKWELTISNWHVRPTGLH